MSDDTQRGRGDGGLESVKYCFTCGFVNVEITACENDGCRWRDRRHEHGFCHDCGHTWTTVWLPHPITVEVES